MTPRKGDVQNPNKVGILLGILPIFILILSSIQSGLASDPVIVDNLDYSFTATWDFDDMTNYTLENLTEANGEVNLTKTSDYWNQSNALDFALGQSNNVIPGDGVLESEDDVMMGYLENQNFTSSNSWEYTNSTGDNIVSNWNISEEGVMYSWLPQNITLQTTTVQPDGGGGKDTYINESNQTQNYGALDTLVIGKNTDHQRGLVQFDVSSLTNVKVVDAILELYFYDNENTTAANISVHRVTRSWTENGATWLNRFFLNPWTSAGGDFDSAIDTVYGIIDSFGWKSWNITSLVDGWVNGTFTNYGILLQVTDNDPEGKLFYSSDAAFPLLRPRLNITYYQLNTFNETSYISQTFQVNEPNTYMDTNETDFQMGVLDNTTVTSDNGGQVILRAGGTFKFDPLDNVTEWSEDPDTTTGKGTYTNTTLEKIEGTDSMKIDMDLSSTLQSYGVRRTTGTFWDWSIYEDLNFWVKSSGYGEVMKVILEDTFGGSWESSPIPIFDTWEKVSFDLSTLSVDISRVDAVKLHFWDTTLAITAYIDNITLTGGLPYDLEGTFSSRIFDGGSILQWNMIAWNETIPASTNIDMKTRTGNTSVPDGTWSGWSAAYSTPIGSMITSPEGRYIQYQAYLNTSDNLVTPVLSEVFLTKMEYNLTFTYSIETFVNISWARLFIQMDSKIIWEKIIDSTSSSNVVELSVSNYLINVSSYNLIIGLTVNANEAFDVNVTAILDDIQVRALYGYYTSIVYDAGTEMAWDSVKWDAEYLFGTDIKLITRTSTDNVTWSNWSNPVAFNYDNIDSPAGRYIQYQVVFSTQNLGVSPVFKWINLSALRYESQGILTFNNDLTALNVTSWGIFSVSDIIRGQSITYQFSIDSGSNWQAVPVDGNLSFVSTSAGKIRFRAIFDTLDTSITPSLQSVNLTYYVNRPPSIIGIVPDQTQLEDGGAWIIDLTPYESDFEDSGTKLKWSITGENTSLYTVSGELSDDDIITFTPLPDAWGNDQVTLWLEDSFGAKTSQTWWINITPQNDGPSIIGTIPSFNKVEDATNWNYDLSVYEYDVDNISSELTWQVLGWDALLFDSVSIVGDSIFFDLAQDANGDDEMTLILSDGLLTDSQNIWVNVTPQNDAPLISGVMPDYDVNEDDLPWILNLTLNETDIDDPYPSASLTWSVSGVDSDLLSISILDNNITFTLKPDAYGNNELTIILTDGGGLTDSQNIWVNVTPANDAPSILGVIPNFDKNEDAVNWNYDLSSFKSDIDNLTSELTWQVMGWDALLFDSVSIVGDTLFFDLASNAYGNDEITIILSDGLLSDSQNFWVNITPFNDAPVINGIIPDYNRNEDDLPWILNLTSYESDVEDVYPSASLTWSVSGVDSNLLSIAITDNNLTFTLKPDAYGDNEITIILTDSGSLTTSQNIWINVTPSNDPPNIVGLIPNFDKNEDALNWNYDLSGYKNDVDNLSSELTWQVMGWDALLFDSVSIVGDTIFFDLTSNVYGNDEITITLSDGLLSDSQNFWVNVTPQNDAPLISGVIPDYDMNEDDLPWILDLTLNETDMDDPFPSPSLCWSVSGVDSNLLSISILDNNITFTLKPDSFGNNEITIILTDAGGLIDSQNIWVNVTPTNDAPSILGVIPNFDKNEDAINWNYDLSSFKSDIDNLTPELTWQVVGWDAALFDSVNIVGDTIFFDLALNVYGNDEITLILSDGLLTDTQNFWVNVTPQNDAPLISGVIPDYNMNEDNLPWTLDLTQNETDIDSPYPSVSLTWSVSGVDSNLLSISILDNNITFTLKPDAYGNNEITIILTDGGGLTDSQNIWVNVTPTNDAPSILGVIPNFDKNEDAINWNYDLSSFKSDIDNLTSELTWQVLGWDALLFDSVSIVGDTIFFDLVLNAYGNDEITVILSDGILTDTQNFRVNVTQLNDAPVINGIISDYNRNEDDLPWILDLTSYESDVEDVYPSASLSWSVTGIDSNLLSISISDNNLTFTLKPDAYGDNEITIILTDSGSLTTSQNIWINVTPSNDPPNIVGLIPNFEKSEDALNWNYDLSGYKYDVDNLSSELTWQVMGWDALLFDSVSIVGDTIFFDLASNVYGNDEITIILSDGLLTDTQNFWVNITPQNDAPLILGVIPDYSQNEDDLPWILDLTSYESDVEDVYPSASLSWSVTGVDSDLLSISISDNNLTFTLKSNAYGDNEITIILTDSGGLIDYQKIWINVTAQNDAPDINGIIPNTQKDEDSANWNFDLASYKFDVDNNNSDLSWSILGWDASLFNSVNIVGDILSFDLVPNAYGNDIMFISLSDGVLFDTQNIWVNVTPINDAPVIQGSIPDMQRLEDSISWTLDLTSFESDLEDGSPSLSLTWNVTDVNTSLISITISDNNLTITPQPNASGINYIFVILRDSGGENDSQWIMVELIPQNDAPIIQPAVPNIVLDEDESITFDLLGYGSDLEDSPSQLRWSIIGSNKSLYTWQIEPGTNRLFIDSIKDAYGTNDVTLILTDSSGGTATQNIQIVIIPINDAPMIDPQVPQSYFETMESQTISIILTSFENDVDDANEFLTWHIEGADSTIITISVNLQSDELIVIPMIEFSPDDTNSVEDEITLVLSDSGGFDDRQNVTVVIYPVNNAPIIKPLPDLMVKYDVPYMFNISPYISDADTDKDQLIVTTSQPYQDLGNGYIKPDGMILTIQYPYSKNGDSFSVVVTASDGQLSSYGIIYITVSDNTPPQLVNLLPDVEFDEDSSASSAFNLGDYFLDLEEGGLNFSFYLNYIYHGDDYIFVSINTDNSVDFTSASDWFGVEEITFRAEDLEGAIIEDTIVVTVNQVNDPPEISGVPDQVCKIDFEKVLDMTQYITDVDTPWDSLTIYTDSDYITVSDSDLIFFYDNVVQEMVTITVTDGFYQDSVTILVTATTNKPPSFGIIPELVVKGGEVYLFSFTPYVIDEDNSWEDLEVWTDSNYINTSQANKLLLELDYPSVFIGQQFDVEVFVTDGQDTNSTTISIYVTDELIPTLIKPLPDLAFDEDTSYDGAINLSHYFKDALVYDFFGNENVDIIVQNGMVSLSSAENWSGVEQITIRGLLGNAFVEDTINVIVRPVNDPPVLSPLPYFDKKINEVWILNLEDYIYDVDTPITNMEISVDSPYVVPFSMKLYFQYQFETYDIVVLTVSDGKNVISGLLFVNVTRDNNAPAYVGLLSTQYIEPGVPWSIDLDDYFYDTDGDQLTFSCNKPEVTINPITHEATWTPSDGSDSLTNVIFTASDGSISIESSPIDLLIESEKAEASFWELYWWVIPLIALLLAFLIIFFLLMRAQEEEEEEKYEIDVDKAVDYLSVHGGNYIIKSEDSDSTYGVFSGLLKSGFEGLCITTKQTENLKDYDLGKAWIIKLDLKRGKAEDGEGEGATMIGMLALGDEQRGDDQYTFASNFSRMVDTVEEFLMAGNKKVVLFDGLEFILVGDEMIMYIGFLASLREKLKEKNSCLLLPIDPKTLSEKELNLLERESQSLEKALAEAPKEKPKEEPKEEEEDGPTDYYSELYDLATGSEAEEGTEDVEDDEVDIQDFQNHKDIDDTDY